MAALRRHSLEPAKAKCSVRQNEACLGDTTSSIQQHGPSQQELTAKQAPQATSAAGKHEQLLPPTTWNACSSIAADKHWVLGHGRIAAD